jgi:hypothetical protein
MLDRASTMLARGREEARADRAEGRADEDRAASTTSTTTTSSVTPAAGSAGTPAPGGGEERTPAFVRASGVRPGASAANQGRAGSGAQGGSGPSFAIVAAFEMKRVRQRGIFKIDLNKYTADSITLRFDENVGDLRTLMANAEHFREVNLDDPLYRQREVVAFVDGTNATDFGQYINFVTVRLRKKHAGGQETVDEVLIDRNKFNVQGNNFKLLYGWKGDNDRRRWLDYDYQTSWSFFGGHAVEQDWRPSTSGAINLAPPYQRRRVDLEADPAKVTTAGIRAITVKVFYDLGSGEQVKQATLNAVKSQLSQAVEFMLPANQLEYAYEITWRLGGDRTVSSGRRTSTDAVLLVDELPQS